MSYVSQYPPGVLRIGVLPKNPLITFPVFINISVMYEYLFYGKYINTVALDICSFV